MLRLTALLLGVALLLTGSGLLGTLLAVRGDQAGFGARALGLIMSGYFAGFFVGTFFAPPLIRRIGHIRAFAFYAALAAIAVLLHPIWLNAWGWGVLRLVTGAALVGLYTVIESCSTPNRTRADAAGCFRSTWRSICRRWRWVRSCSPSAMRAHRRCLR